MQHTACDQFYANHNSSHPIWFVMKPPCILHIKSQCISKSDVISFYKYLEIYTDILIGQIKQSNITVMLIWTSRSYCFGN